MLDKLKSPTFEEAILRFWYRKSFLAYLLVPFSWIFYILSRLRFYWLVHLKQPATFETPIIIVGNISLGGTGKTPLVVWLVKFLMKKGYQPGIIMRGFKGSLKSHEVKSVTQNSHVAVVGDEPLLLASKCQCPLVVGKNRKEAITHLLKHSPEVNIIICDDGLQHYALARDIEIAVMDGTRRLGNGFCLPAGPLREPPSRLRQVDFVVLNGKAQENEWLMTVQFENDIFQIQYPLHKYSLMDFKGKKVHAIAGIGNPEKFFSMLTEKGIEFIEHRFPDHHLYTAKDFVFADNLPIIMTEKDAVKCVELTPQAFVIPLKVYLPDEFGQLILRRIRNGQKIIRHTRLSNLQATSIIREGK